MTITSAEYRAILQRNGTLSPAAPAQSPRTAGGEKARNAGKDFEREILASAPLEGATLIQIKNFAKRIYDSTTKEMKIVEEKSPFDFAGTLRGAPCFIDAKSVNPDIASFRVNDKKIVKPHQINALFRLQQSGAIAGFLVKCGRMKDIRWIDARDCIKRVKPVGWDDPCWIVLGPISPMVPLGKLGRVKQEGLF